MRTAIGSQFSLEVGLALSAAITDFGATTTRDVAKPKSPVADPVALRKTVDEFARACGIPFTLINAETGELIYADRAALGCDLTSRLGLLCEIANRGAVEIVEDEAPLGLVAIPLRKLGCGRNLIATGAFVTQAGVAKEAMASAAQVLGVDLERLWLWTHGREVCAPSMFARLATATLERLCAIQSLFRLEAEAADAIAHAEETNTELGLLHKLTSGLHLAEDDLRLWGAAAAWLADASPAQVIALVLKEDLGGLLGERASLDTSKVILHGHIEATTSQISQLAHQLGERSCGRTVVCNQAETSLATWPLPQIRELVCAPIANGNMVHGWLLALNHRGTSDGSFAEFGSIEARLMQSVGTILGIHAGNKRLFHRQADLFLSSVRALSSAIDAKDRYTAGHSDRVARLSVCLGRQLGISRHDIETIYLGGLLHDIGKIGIDDNILNKPGKLTADEFAHVRQHPQLGYDILQGVSPLKSILPIVLHHHEAWDGSGYPHALTGDETPILARIVAVADAFDAMSSDRPYRKGLEDEKVDGILRDGAGSQWDARVVEAFFRIRDEVRDVACGGSTLGEVSIDPAHWVN